MFLEDSEQSSHLSYFNIPTMQLCMYQICTIGPFTPTLICSVSLLIENPKLSPNAMHQIDPPNLPGLPSLIFRYGKCRQVWRDYLKLCIWTKKNFIYSFCLKNMCIAHRGCRCQFILFWKGLTYNPNVGTYTYCEFLMYAMA